MVLTRWRVMVVAAAVATLLASRPRAARACSPPGPLRLGTIWPPGGATAVPANVRFVVTYQGLPSNAEQMAAVLELSIRPLGGSATVPVLVRSLAGGLRSETRVSVQPMSDLAVGQDFELLGRVGPPSSSGFSTIEPTPVPMLQFRTGLADRTAPVFAGASGFSATPDLCDSTACCGPHNGYNITFTTPTLTEPAILAVYPAGGGEILALDRWWSLFYPCSGTGQDIELRAGEYVVRAVDEAGNEDSNDRRVRLDLPCPALAVDAGAAGVDAGVAVRHDAGGDAGTAGGDDAGCRVAGGRPGAGGRGAGLVVLAALAGAWLRRRRRAGERRRVRTAAVVAVAAMALAVQPPDAGACTGPGALRLSSVWPPDGTPDVPANVRFVVSYAGVATFAEQSIAMRALEIRPAGGGTPVPVLVNDLEGGGRLVVLVGVHPVADLEEGKDYELAGRIAPCTDGSGMCPIEPTPVVIARFHTQAADHTAPVFAGATGVTGTPVVCEGACSCTAHTGAQVSFTVAAPAEPVLYAFREVGKPAVVGLGAASAYGECTGSGPYFGPRVTLGAKYVVRAVDRAGNEDDNQREVLVDVGCPQQGGGGGSGCAVGLGVRGRTTAGFAAVLLVIGLLGLVWVRGRVYVARR